MGALNPIDLAGTALYFAGVLAVAWWASRQRKDQSADCFLAGRHTGWFIVGPSPFVSNIGSEHLVGLSASGAAKRFAVGHFEWLAVLILLLLARLVLELAHGRVGLPPGSVWEWYATVQFLHFAPGAVRAVLRLLGRADARTAANSR